MALVKNLSARLITIQAPHRNIAGADGRAAEARMGKGYMIRPAGKAVEVPDELLKGKWVEALIDGGDLAIVGESKTKVAAVEPEEAESEEDAIKAKLDELEIKYRSNASLSTLKKLLEEAE